MGQKRRKGQEMEGTGEYGEFVLSKQQPVDGRAEVAVIPVSMATQMCRRCSDASRELCAVAVLT